MTKRKYIKPPRSEDCVWRSGPPPEIGWWPADWGKYPQPECLRWWDGSRWSDFAFSHDDAEFAGLQAACRPVRSDIRWTDRWWEEK